MNCGFNRSTLMCSKNIFNLSSTTERNPHPKKTLLKLPESIAEQNPNVKQTFVETYRPEIDQKIKQVST